MEGQEHARSTTQARDSKLFKRGDEGKDESKSVRPPFNNDYGAFVSYHTLLPTSSPEPPAAPAPLAGLTFAIKDIFDVEGLVTGFGNPDWARTHGPAKRTAPAVQVLLDAGATSLGLVHMDEMAYSILGENKQYGTPVNPAAPSRMPGGSSSGSAVAVAAKLVDFSLGTDTGGSVRVPASFCGILGFRPSHGGVSTVGVTPMAQSLDTVGWFARDITVFWTAGHLLLETLRPQGRRQPQRFLIADDCFKMSSIPEDTRLGIITNSITRKYGDQVLEHINLGDHIASKVFSLKEFTEKNKGFNINEVLGALDDVVTLILRWEFKMNHEEWVASEKPNLGSEIAWRVKTAMDTTSHLMTLALQVKEEVRHAINELLKEDGILVLPTVPGPPPKLLSGPEALELYCAKAFALLSISVLSSCCQVSMPTGEVDDGPIAVSFLARQGNDHFLLDTAAALYPTIQDGTKAALHQVPRSPISRSSNRNGFR